MSNKNTPGGRTRIHTCDVQFPDKPCPECKRQKSFAARSATQNAIPGTLQSQTVVSGETPREAQPVETQEVIPSVVTTSQEDWTRQWRKPARIVSSI